MSGLQVGLVGAGVMGAAFAQNLRDHGFQVLVYDQDRERALRLEAESRAFLAKHPHIRGTIRTCSSMKELMERLASPRLVLIFVPAGSALREAIRELVSAGAAPDDVAADCGNSRWQDCRELAESCRGTLCLMGSGVSGGAAGARVGPALMPSGDEKGWELLRPVWEAAAARVDPASGEELTGAAPCDPSIGGEPCVGYLGGSGVGHFVKTVHNGIEYGDLQLLAECYWVLRRCTSLDAGEISRVFRSWMNGPASGYLLDAAAVVLNQPDPKRPGGFLVDRIADRARQKGTGKWTVQDSLDAEMPFCGAESAVMARNLSALIGQRRLLAGRLPTRAKPCDWPFERLVEGLHDALCGARLVHYAQAHALMRCAGKLLGGEEIDLVEVFRTWRGGCIIRGRLTQQVYSLLRENPKLPNLLLTDYFQQELGRRIEGWRELAAMCQLSAVPCPEIQALLVYYDACAEEECPQNLVQGIRDYFGSHGFELKDEDGLWHFLWNQPDGGLIRL